MIRRIEQASSCADATIIKFVLRSIATSFRRVNCPTLRLGNCWVREGVDFATMTLIDVIRAKRSNQRRKPWPRQSSERRRAATLRRPRRSRSGNGRLRICRSARGRLWVNKPLRWLAESAGRPDSGEEPYRRLFAPHGDIKNRALAVDQEQGEIARFHRIGEALKRRKIGNGLAV